MNEAISLKNDGRYGLTASKWTGEVARTQHVGDRIETGTVFLNRAVYLDSGLSWTGSKNSLARCYLRLAHIA